MGDGLLAEFASVVEAVKCAVAIQKGMAQRNIDVLEDRKLEFRIGINLGDVVFENGDLFGDGAMLQQGSKGCRSREVFVSRVRYEIKFEISSTMDWKTGVRLMLRTFPGLTESSKFYLSHTIRARTSSE